ncbi:MAG TPA: amino acid ABC transporter permease [Hypericibacter adhaerens]|uniref:amino acid ABC transporter permease n=1 Tax=Hypericibacter adhaerens TaxID=2602016 RepID=UPI002C4FF899|nr:amino acid ABC transporter permease [Hypericibacter adhaerens]HWA43901.1 amino acid ABC transporter permease [Hypericibacter adhaerens]
MSSSTAPEPVRPSRRRVVTPPKDAVTAASLALAGALAVVAATWWLRSVLSGVLVDLQVDGALGETLLLIASVASLLLLLPAYRAWQAAQRGRTARLAADIITARVQGAAARTWCWYTFGYAVAVLLVLAIALFIVLNDVAVGRTFFFLPLIFDSFHLVFDAFWVNVFIFCVAEVFVLIWGLVVAIARLIPGEPGRPIRMIATAYIDVFRGLPAIISIYLVGFGLPLTGLPIIRDFPLEWYAILALTLTYGAYVAEVYRAGIESIHQSQTAAARSLGLSYAQTLRYVVIPQAVRRIIPPLLNDFISLQKDTALVNVIGAIDAFNQAKIVASNHFNLSSVTTVAFLFVVITIPQARFVDRLIERDQRRMRAAG